MTTTTSRTLQTTLLLVGAVLAADPGEAIKRRAFATSVTGTGDLGSWPEAGAATGLAAGDAICRFRADQAGLPNANTYRAWLSDSNTDAYCHVQGLTGPKAACVGGPPQAAGPWYLANGITNFTASLADLAHAPWEIYRPVLMDEHGVVLPTDGPRTYWTATDADGNATLPEWTCADWTTSSSSNEGLVGDGLRSAKFWTASGSVPLCSSPQRLLCLEPGVSEEVRLGWSPGNLVFLTSNTGSGNLSTWPEAGGQTGLAAGDAICRNLAAAAQLPAPESFVAWLSSSTVDAGDRLTANGPFRRVDAYLVANSKADLLDGNTQNSIHVHEDGSYLINAPFSTGTGTLADGTAAADTCSNWTSTSGNRAAGQPSAARNEDWTDWTTLACSTTTRLYCLSNKTTIFWDGFELTGDTSRWSSQVP